MILVLGSASGTRGFQWGTVSVPLTVDGYFRHTAVFPNQFPLGNTAGFLDTNGRAQATFTLPRGLPPALVGIALHHAFVTYTVSPAGLTAGSNAAVLSIVP